MTILPHNLFSHYIQQCISQTLSQVNKVIDVTNHQFTIRNYADSIETIASLTQELARTMLIESLELMDRSFLNSDYRKSYYYVKVTRKRTLITMFGTITYTRTIYQSKLDGSIFTYVDRKLGLPKYDRYDPTIKAKVIELYADHNSMIKVGEIVGEQIYSLFSTKKERKNFNLSRQTVQNIVKKSLLIQHPIPPSTTTPDVLYVMADEKFIPLQNSNKKSAFVRHGVIFEGIQSLSNNRYQLTNRWVYSDLTSSFWSTMDDLLYKKYNMDKVKVVYVMGDGAKWIKKGAMIIPNGQSMLDKFHAFQAIQHISKDIHLQGALKVCIFQNDKRMFKKIIAYCLDFHQDDFSKVETIQTKSKYLLNNWKSLQRTITITNPGCSMEAQISHNIAATFTSRPKAYASQHLQHYLQYRDLHNNGIDLLNLYLDTLHYTPTDKALDIFQESHDYSIFEPRHRYDKSSNSDWVKGFIAKN